jgi:hypothetical protein
MPVLNHVLGLVDHFKRKRDDNNLSAVEALLLDEERFSKSARYVYAIGRYTPWLMRYNEQESMSAGQLR